MKLPVLTIVGRPNVGKSTLFNYLTASRQALVAAMAGVTRDRQYGRGDYQGQAFIVIDTGGLSPIEAQQAASAIQEMTREQAQQAIDEADYVLFVVDGKSGLTAEDQQLFSQLRQQNLKHLICLVNKADRLSAAEVAGEFYQLGAENLHVIAAKGGRGIDDLLASLLAPGAPDSDAPDDDATIDHAPASEPATISNENENALATALQSASSHIADESKKKITIAVIGRPNVGKSTLVNTILGQKRVLVFDEAGTTHDSVAIDFKRRGQDYTLIDTAGIRRRARIDNTIEKFSVVQSMQAISQADVVLVMLDAQAGVHEQDMRLLRFVLNYGCGAVLVFNKWDLLDDEMKAAFKSQVDRRLGFVDFLSCYEISALKQAHLGELFSALTKVHKALTQDFQTSDLTQILQQAVTKHEPPLLRGRRIKLRYAHIGDLRPLSIVIHGKQVESLAGSYQRYLIGFFRRHLKLRGVCLHLKLVTDHNPYVDET